MTYSKVMLINITPDVNDIKCNKYIGVYINVVMLDIDKYLCRWSAFLVVTGVTGFLALCRAASAHI